MIQHHRAAGVIQIPFGQGHHAVGGGMYRTSWFGGNIQTIMWPPGFAVEDPLAAIDAADAALQWPAKAASMPGRGTILGPDSANDAIFMADAGQYFPGRGDHLCRQAINPLDLVAPRLDGQGLGLPPAVKAIPIQRRGVGKIPAKADDEAAIAINPHGPAIKFDPGTRRHLALHQAALHQVAGQNRHLRQGGPGPEDEDED